MFKNIQSNSCNACSRRPERAHQWAVTLAEISSLKSWVLIQRVRKKQTNKQTKQKAKQQCGVILTPSRLVVGSQHIYAQRVVWGCRLNTTWSHPLPPQLTLPLRWRRHDWLRLLTWSPSALLPAPRSWTLCLLCPNLQALTRNKGHAPWVWAHRLLGYNSHVLTVFNSYKC